MKVASLIIIPVENQGVLLEKAVFCLRKANHLNANHVNWYDPVTATTLRVGAFGIALVAFIPSLILCKKSRIKFAATLIFFLPIFILFSCLRINCLYRRLPPLPSIEPPPPKVHPSIGLTTDTSAFPSEIINLISVFVGDGELTSKVCRHWDYIQDKVDFDILQEYAKKENPVSWLHEIDGDKLKRYVRKENDPYFYSKMLKNYFKQIGDFFEAVTGLEVDKGSNLNNIARGAIYTLYNRITNRTPHPERANYRKLFEKIEDESLINFYNHVLLSINNQILLQPQLPLSNQANYVRNWLITNKEAFSKVDLTTIGVFNVYYIPKELYCFPNIKQLHLRINTRGKSYPIVAFWIKQLTSLETLVIDEISKNNNDPYIATSDGLAIDYKLTDRHGRFLHYTRNIYFDRYVRAIKP